MIVFPKYCLEIDDKIVNDKVEEATLYLSYKWTLDAKKEGSDFLESVLNLYFILER